MNTLILHKQVETLEDTLKEKDQIKLSEPKPAVLLSGRSDEEIAGLVQNGSDAAFAELVKRYMHKSYSLAFQIVGDYEAARDLSQDVFVKIHRSIGKYKKGKKFFSWYYRILLNHCINYTRRKKVISMLPFSEAFSREEEVPETTIYRDEDSDTESETAYIVRSAVDKLPGKHRQIIVLCELEGFSQEETAEILEISIGTVRSRLHYARKSLKKLLTKQISEYENEL